MVGPVITGLVSGYLKGKVQFWCHGEKSNFQTVIITIFILLKFAMSIS